MHIDKIRPMRTADLDRVRTWRNHPDVNGWMFDRKQITEEEHVNWFLKNCNNSDNHLLIYEINDIPSGFVQFSRLYSSAVAKWGFYRSPDAPQGIGSQMGAAMLLYGFEKLALDKVYGEVLASNNKSLALHRRLGFFEEGCLRKQYFNGLEYVDLYCFGLFRPEFFRSNQSSEQNNVS